MERTPQDDREPPKPADEERQGKDLEARESGDDKVDADESVDADEPSERDGWISDPESVG